MIESGKSSSDADRLSRDLEDSGYMTRAAFVMDRVMRAIGLPGKSFVPLIVGFGCNVPAIMATRTLESRHDRILTIMMAPFMSCGVRLPEGGGRRARDRGGKGKPRRKAGRRVQTIPENLAGVVGLLKDPLKLNVSYTGDAAQAANTLKVEPNAFAAMATRFDGPVGAFAYLLMILLYMPCVAAVGAIYQEIGWRWTLFSATWNTSLGWCAAVVFYQTMRFDRAPMTASLWIGACFAALVAALAALAMIGQASARARRSKENRQPFLPGSSKPERAPS